MSTVTKADQSQPEFGKIRAALWPIHTHELKKFLPMGMMMFFILFNYSILRTLKDSMIVTAAGAPVVPYLKGLVVMPAAILFVILYTKLVNALSREAVFQLLIGSFITFFAVFAFLIFPNRAFLHPDPQTIMALKEAYPNIQHLISIYAYWTFSIFYTLAELWGSIMIALLFWQFANEIVRTQEAKRFYALFGLLANFALILSSMVLKSVKGYEASLGGGDAAFEATLPIMCGAVFASGLFTMYIYNWMGRNVLTDPRFYDAAEAANKPQKKKPKLSVGESFKLILSSRYLMFIALLILAYGVSMNLIELGFKEVAQNQFPTKAAYKDFMADLQFYTGIATIIAILFFKGIISRFGWFIGAIITPLMMAVTGALFFMFYLFGDFMSPVTAIIGISSLSMAFYVGLAQNVLSKGTKYSLFDPTKEMAYIPLDPELKSKGKAAVDVIGGRLGKAGGGYISLALFSVTAAADVLTIAPYIALLSGVVIVLWIISVGGLSKMYHAKLEETKK